VSAGAAIVVESVGYRAGGKAILSDISFDVARGEVLSLMGRSGSGKTTLLKCLGALIRPTSGRIAIGGEDVVSLPEAGLDRVRLRIGFVFQYAALFDSMTVFDNVAFGLVQHRRSDRPGGRKLESVVRDRLADVHLEGAESLYPSELSGGMQKRVGLARALATDPDVLLYDEPTSGLDPVTARAIDDLIVETRDRIGVTSVIVSHDIPTILRISDRAAMIHEGMLVALDTPERLRESAQPAVQEFVRASAGAETPPMTRT
jgi:phospholipid/cholesterol/gamma-HCH transport system ATP-binding protein